MAATSSRHSTSRGHAPARRHLLGHHAPALGPAARRGPTPERRAEDDGRAIDHGRALYGRPPQRRPAAHRRFQFSATLDAARTMSDEPDRELDVSRRVAPKRRKRLAARPASTASRPGPRRVADDWNATRHVAEPVSGHERPAARPVAGTAPRAVPCSRDLAEGARRRTGSPADAHRSSARDLPSEGVRDDLAGPAAPGLETQSGEAARSSGHRAADDPAAASSTSRARSAGRAP